MLAKVSSISAAVIVSFLCYIPVSNQLQHKSHALVNAPGLRVEGYPYCVSTSNPSYDCRGKPNGNYPNPVEPCSNYFFKCVSDVSYCYNCQNITLPSGEQIVLFYERRYEQCLFRDEVADCNGVTVTTTTTSTSTTTIPPTTTTAPTETTPTTTTLGPTLPDGFRCPSMNGNFPIELVVCRKDYYQCINGVPNIATCPGDSYFDPNERICKNPGSLSCTLPTTTTTGGPITTPTPTPTGPPVYRCPEQNGFFPINQNECSADYYSCVSGSPYVATCPSPSLFDPIRRVCLLPNDTSCNFRCAEDGFFAVPGFENFCYPGYIVCVLGISTVGIPYPCPGTSLFDPTLTPKACVPADVCSLPTPGTNVPTAPTTAATTTTSTTTVAPTTPPPSCNCNSIGFTCPSATGNYGCRCSCSLYFVCSGGNYIITQCPIGEVFDPEQEFCVPPGTVPGCSFVSFLDYYRDSKLVGIRGGPSS